MNEYVFCPDFAPSHKVYTMKDHPGVYKLVVRSKGAVRYSTLKGDTWEVQETHNYHEPYDAAVHVFYLRDCWLKDGMTLKMYYRNRTRSKFCAEVGRYAYTEFVCDLSDVREENELIPEICDTGIVAEKSEEHPLSDGITWTEVTGKDKDGLPMKWFYFTVKHGKGTFRAGTADDGTLPNTAIQTVEGQALAVVAKGLNVVGATNADFFDMFSDNHPSGPVIKDGNVITNGDSDRAFFGVDKTGEPVIGDFRHEPWLKGNMKEAVAGLQRILKNGEFGDVWPGERFCSDRHPRTAVGITAEKDVFVFIVDGRLPEHSNGMTLYDVAVKLKELGAVNAINLDGGGSSTFLVKLEEGFKICNFPVDARTPGVVGIREIFNTLLIVANN
ncbi:MAG: phosphodiester glycosidase family protein [Clostridia bacterium]|nr:phosphodiester glycosidase family protein [Clostridia bacterium]